MLKTGILCSGGLGMKSLLHLHNRSSIDIQFILTDKKSKPIVDFCRRHSIPVFVGNPRHGKGTAFANQFPVDVIASVNYLFLIEQDLIDHATKIAFNIHGSLLPRYRGRTPHVWAIIHGERQVGVTAHQIELECDAGDIIEQVPIPVNDDDTGGRILEKYAACYGPLLDRVFNSIESDSLTYRTQDKSLATQFGKRTPEDGQIDWSWNAERIRNWVRAQAAPYPGAFTWYDGQKIVIDQVRLIQPRTHDELARQLTDQHSNRHVGTILRSESGLFVQAADVVLEITRIRNIDFSIDQTLNNFVSGTRFETATTHSICQSTP